MGYYTSYTLLVSDESHRHVLENGLGFSQEAEVLKWHEYEKDCLSFSKAHPDILFGLHGVGEEHGDEWVHWFKGGLGEHINRGKWKIPSAKDLGLPGA